MPHTCVLLCIVLALLSPALSSFNIYGVSPSCGPELSFSVVTINGTGLLDLNTTIRVGDQYLDPSLLLSQNNNSISFLTPKLPAGVYPLQMCSNVPFYNCSQACVTTCTTQPVNCTIPECVNSTNSVCTQNCSESCVLINTTNSCSTIAAFTSYDIPAVLLSINPSATTHKSNISLYGKHFMDCGKATVRVQSTNAIQDFPAWFNSSTQIVFYVDTSITGSISLSLDGQHFDSISPTPLTLTTSTADDSESASPEGGKHILNTLHASPSPLYTNINTLI